MSPLDNSPDESALDELAGAWLYERAEGFTPERAQAFAEWRSDPAHQEAISRIELTMAILDEMPEVREPLEQRWASLGEHPESAGLGRVVQFPMWVWLTAAAAMVILGLGIRWGWSRGFDAEAHYITAEGSQRTLSLPDGSVLDIDENSDVAIRFSARERRVDLARGEAHFQVAHNAARPFIVTAHGVAVRAVGTAFDVRLGPEAVEVVVNEGKVELSRERAPSVSAAADARPVSAGQRAKVSPEVTARPQVEKIDANTIRSLLAWQDRTTNFTDVPLRELVARCNRRNVTQLVLQDADLGNRKIGGVVDLGRVDAFVQLLELDGDVVAQRSEGGTIILRRAR